MSAGEKNNKNKKQEDSGMAGMYWNGCMSTYSTMSIFSKFENMAGILFFLIII
jgi:hypothetical protein